MSPPAGTADSSQLAAEAQMAGLEAQVTPTRLAMMPTTLPLWELIAGSAETLHGVLAPYVRVYTIVQHGVKMALRDSDDEAPEETIEEKRLLQSWRIMCEIIPDFSEQMIGLGVNNKLRKQVCTEIQAGLNGARGDDTRSLKADILNYLEPPPALPVPNAEGDDQPPKVPKMAAKGTKADRGFFNPLTTRLLMPVKYPATEETFSQIRDGAKPIYGTEIPYFMYRDGMEVDPDDMDEGFLESHVMFATAKHIHQGPTAALKGPGVTRGKAGNAALNGITALIDRDVAYVACQARFGMSSQQNWNMHDGTFNYSDFYWSVVDVLRGDEGQDIIDRFNYAVFGTKKSTKRSATAAAVGPSDFDVLEAQRAAKRARKIEAAAAATSASSASAAS
ncbi:hypothetical protein MVEN_00708800 [Mycena venus]|uniref:Uncharacterized protein n=1 Tax=Mycena venus TaxID=2733690 RepID=A0A8H6YIX0_9AGAR|nr:hypothetical protein MVEN_00708800 [Mycena venus]